VIAAQRAYSNASRWIKSARPRRLDAGRFALRSFAGNLVAGLFVLGLFGLLSPSSFGTPASRPLRSGAITWVLLGLVGICALTGAAQRSYLRGLWARLREPYVRRLDYHEHFQGAADALAECPATMQSRWAFRWVWTPMGLAIAGVFFSFSTAYFGVAAILAGGRVGWGQPLLALINAALAVLAFRLGAVRLSTWRLAVSVHRDVTGRYD
jgi:hypothetical protein